MALATLILLAVTRQASPSQVIQRFLDAWNQHDFATMASLTIGGKAVNFSGIPKTADWPTFATKDMKEAITGDVATVSLTVVGTASDGSMSHAETDTLRRVSGQWMIVPGDPSARDAGVVVTLAGLATHGFDLAGAKAAAMKTACLSNVKQLGLACLMYANDNDDKFMKSAAVVHKSLDPYLRNAKLWNCPLTGKPAYSFNSRLFGKSMESISNPALTVMIYEGKNFALDFRHAGSAAVCFVDGHAKMIDKKAAASLHWRP